MLQKKYYSLKEAKKKSLPQFKANLQLTKWCEKMTDNRLVKSSWWMHRTFLHMQKNIYHDILAFIGLNWGCFTKDEKRAKLFKDKIDDVQIIG